MSKHMDINDRQNIIVGLKNADSFGVIAKRIGKCETTVSREVRNHRIVWDKKPYGRSSNRCINRTSCARTGVCNPDCHRKCSICGQCTRFCPDYIEEHCEKLNRPPYVCDSYARPSLGNKTPMDMLAVYYGETRAQKLLRLLGHYCV